MERCGERGAFYTSPSHDLAVSNAAKSFPACEGPLCTALARMQPTLLVWGRAGSINTPSPACTCYQRPMRKPTSSPMFVRGWCLWGTVMHFVKRSRKSISGGNWAAGFPKDVVERMIIVEVVWAFVSFAIQLSSFPLVLVQVSLGFQSQWLNFDNFRILSLL